MGRFEQEFKNYESYRDDNYYRKTVPDNLIESLADLFANTCGIDENPETVGRMGSVVSDLLVLAGRGATTNWDIGPLRTEMKAALQIASEVRFDRFMDGTRIVVERLYKEMSASCRADFLNKVNSLFNDSNFGYNLLTSINEPDTLRWEARWKADTGVAALMLASESLDELFPEALEHIQQAKDHLLRPGELRSRKDSVRDALSALESMLKKLTSEKDIDKATRKLRDEKYWGVPRIIKDGQSIWKHLHDLYPDMRHGHQVSSEIELDEAVYWLGRIAVYIKYLADRNKAIGRK